MQKTTDAWLQSGYEFANKTNRVFKPYQFISVVLIYTIAVYFNYVRKKYMINPDGVSYLQIARYYADFDLIHAMNGYWSPMLSLLMAPFIRFFAMPQNAFWLVNFVTGILILKTCLQYLNACKAWYLLNTLWVLLLLPFLLFAQFYVVSPDFLTIYMLLVFLQRIRKTDITSWKDTIWLALVISLAYYVKYYNLPVLLLISFAIFLSGKESRLTRIRACARLLVLCLTGTIIWMVFIYVKYDRVSLTTSASYNFNLQGPNASGHPFLKLGVQKPFKDAPNVWLDPSYIETKNWSPFSSTYNFQLFLYNINTQLVAYRQMLVVDHGRFLLWCLAIAMALLITKQNIAIVRNELLLLLLYPVLYFFTIFEDRYFWICIPLVALTMYKLLMHCEKNKWLQLFLMVVVSLVVFDNLTRVYFKKMKEGFYGYKELYETCNDNHFPIRNGHIAADCKIWYTGLYVAFYTNSTYYNCSETGSMPTHDKNLFYLGLKELHTKDFPKALWIKEQNAWAVYRER